MTILWDLATALNWFVLLLCLYNRVFKTVAQFTALGLSSSNTDVHVDFVQQTAVFAHLHQFG